MQLSAVVFFFLADFPLSTEDVLAVLGNLGNTRSDMVIRAVVHFMEAASKKC